MRARSTRLAGSVRDRASASSRAKSPGSITNSITRRGAAMGSSRHVDRPRPTMRSVTLGMRHIGAVSWNRCTSAEQQDFGGKVLSARTRPSGSRAAALLRLAATTIGRTETALGAFYRRLSGRIGKAKAVTATARKLAVLFYNMLRHGKDYADPGASYYEERYRRRVLINLQRRAKAFGYVLQPTEIKVVSMAVS